MRPFIVIASVMVLSAMNVTLSAAGEDVGVLGSGNSSCATYIIASRGITPGQRKSIENKKDSRTYFSANSTYEDWILGFISALNADRAAFKLSRSEIKVDNAGVFESIRRWCGDHPESSVFDAAVQFAGSQTNKAK